MITVREIRTPEDISAIVELGHTHQSECAPNLSFNGGNVQKYCEATTKDIERFGFNVWIARLDDVPIGYACASCSPLFHCDTIAARLLLVYVLPEYRGGWGFIRLVKVYEEWAKANGSQVIVVGVERTEADKAKKIRELFPKMGYKWSGSTYLKEMI